MEQRHLTTKQQVVFDFIRQTAKRYGKAPTDRVIAERFGMSVNGTFSHVKAIEAKGYLSRVDGKIVLSKERM